MATGFVIVKLRFASFTLSQNAGTAGMYGTGMMNMATAADMAAAAAFASNGMFYPQAAAAIAAQQAMMQPVIDFDSISSIYGFSRRTTIISAILETDIVQLFRVRIFVLDSLPAASSCGSVQLILRIPPLILFLSPVLPSFFFFHSGFTSWQAYMPPMPIQLPAHLSLINQTNFDPESAAPEGSR